MHINSKDNKTCHTYSKHFDIIPTCIGSASLNLVTIWHSLRIVCSIKYENIFETNFSQFSRLWKMRKASISTKRNGFWEETAWQPWNENNVF